LAAEPGSGHDLTERDATGKYAGDSAGATLRQHCPQGMQGQFLDRIAIVSAM
jgi:hypothetical protein